VTRCSKTVNLHVLRDFMREYLLRYVSPSHSQCQCIACSTRSWQRKSFQSSCCHGFKFEICGRVPFPFNVVDISPTVRLLYLQQMNRV
jgi:hypothetical protein